MCSYRQKKKRKSLPSQIRSITELWRAIPKQPLPLANQSQQIAAVNISDSADLNKDIMIISLLYSTPRMILEAFSQSQCEPHNS